MPAEAVWVPAALSLLRNAASRTANAARRHVAAVARPLGVGSGGRAHAVPRFATSLSRPANPLDQILRRLFSSISSSSTSAARAARFIKGRPTVADIAAARSPYARRTPFGVSCRPAAGGALPRSTIGVGLGGGSARHFTQGPPAPAEIVQNVSQAMRAFMISGKRARYDSTNKRGNKMYRAISAAEDAAARNMADCAHKNLAAGAYIDYRISPVVTAVNPVLASAIGPADKTCTTLNGDNFLDLLAGDFERAARELNTIMKDLKKLAFLGDLPITMQGSSVLRVRFPGMDAETVERICDDLGICRGYIGEDPEFKHDLAVENALKFPFAPDKRGLSPASPGNATRSTFGPESELCASDEDCFEEVFLVDELAARPWMSDPENLSSLSSGTGTHTSIAMMTPVGNSVSDYEGLEGIHRFLAACDRAGGRIDR